MNSINHQIRPAARPSGLPKPSDWELTTEPVPAPGPREFVVAVTHLSIDPAMRTWIKACRAIGIAGGSEQCRWITEDLASTQPSTTRPKRCAAHYGITRPTVSMCSWTM